MKFYTFLIRKSYLTLSFLTLPYLCDAQSPTPIFEGKLMAHGEQQYLAFGHISVAHKHLINQYLNDLNTSFEQFDIFQFPTHLLDEYLSHQASSTAFILKFSEKLSWKIVLTPQEIRREGMVEQIITPNGIREVAVKKTLTYKGFVDEPGGGDVRITLNEGFLSGYLTHNGKRVFIENSANIVEEAPQEQLLVYYEEDLIYDETLMCHAEEAPIPDKQFNEVGTAEACHDTYEMEIAVVAANSLYESFGRDEKLVRNYILSTINNSQGDYERFNVTFVVVELIIFTSPNQSPFTNTDRNVAASIDPLRQWSPTGFSEEHDIGMLFLDGAGTGTIGIAYVGSVCTSSRYCVVDKLGSVGASRTLVSHELGHSFSANHVSGTNIMRPSLMVTQNWANSSIQAIEQHIATRKCLACLDKHTPTDPDPPFQPDLCSPGEEELMDNEDRGYREIGSWSTATYRIGRNRFTFRHDRLSGKGQKVARFIPDLPNSGTYQVYMYWPKYYLADQEVPVNIVSAEGSDTRFIDQRNEGWEWKLMGTYYFDINEPAYVDILTDGTSRAYVFADQVRFICGSSSSLDQDVLSQLNEALDFQEPSLSFLDFYPNPTSDLLYIGHSGSWQGNSFLQIIDPTGRVIKEHFLSKDKENVLHKVSVEELNSGVYMIQMDENGHKTTQKIIIQ